MIKYEERFAKTAVGWALMEKSKTNPDFTISFVKKQEKYVNNESLKRALKYINVTLANYLTRFYQFFLKKVCLQKNSGL